MVKRTIRRSVLNDDVLYLADKGKVFPGGYVAILEYYTYANNWSDTKHVRRFKTLANAKKYINKLMGVGTI